MPNIYISDLAAALSLSESDILVGDSGNHTKSFSISLFDSRYASINVNFDDVYFPINGNFDDRYFPINGNFDERYFSLNGNFDGRYFKPGSTIDVGSNCWEDLKFPATGINPTGPATTPSVDNVIAGLLFSSSVENTISIIAQMPHSWKKGSNIDPHIHWQKTTSASGGVFWQLKYRWAKIGDVMDANWTTVGTSTPVQGTTDNNTANQHLISAFPEISGAGKVVSDILIMQLSRVPADVADTYAADARMLEFDIHYQIDSIGSDLLYAKT